ncbi:MAG TPA: hypothetical protein VGH79_11250 [Gaiellaceae bacterium]
MAFAHDVPVRTRPQLVAALLDQIEELRQRAYLAQANGVLPAGMRDLKKELRRLRAELALAVSVGARRTL